MLQVCAQISKQENAIPGKIINEGMKHVHALSLLKTVMA